MPQMRCDIVDVYVFRRTAQGTLEFLQMRRAQGALSGSWHPVMGHMEAGEKAPATALRELAEETGYAQGAGLLRFWQLELVNTYYLASHESIVMSPGFAAEVDPAAPPRLDASHDAFRWVARDHAERVFLWPGQRAAIAHIVRDILVPSSPIEPLLRLPMA